MNIKKISNRDLFEQAVDERFEYLDNIMRNEYELLKHRYDVSMLDEWLIIRSERCLDSKSTDALLKLNTNNRVYAVQYSAIKTDNYYINKALDELFNNNIDNWNDEMFEAFVRVETDRIMMGYVKEIQMEELALTGILVL